MRIGIPVDRDEGLRSPVCGHFGSAPAFIVVDTATGSYRVLPNNNRHHVHGACKPLASLRGERLDAVAVGGIGRGALSQLCAAQVPVYVAGHPTVAEVIEAAKAGTLRLLGADDACHSSHHDHA